jgi:hypothetical protein
VSRSRSKPILGEEQQLCCGLGCIQIDVKANLLSGESRSFHHYQENRAPGLFEDTALPWSA